MREQFENGDQVIAFMGENLVHGPGDHGGEPWLPVEWQADFIRAWFERQHGLLRDRRRYRNGLLLTPKGCGKTELAGALAVVEMCNRRDADVVIAAASWDQASLLMDSAAACCSHPNSPMAGLVTVTEGEIRLTGTASKVQRVASDAGSNDGKRPTALFVDELHEFGTEARQRNYEVLVAGAAKRSAPVLVTSTVGADRDSLLGRLVDVQEQGNDTTSLYVYHGAQGLVADLDLDDRVQFREAVLRSNPSARGADAFVDLDAIVARAFELRPAARRRYYLNLWGEGGDEQWLPEGRWAELVDRGRENGAPLYLGFDGSVRGDSTAIVGVTVDEDNNRPHVSYVRVWEGGGKAIPRDEVQAELESLFARYEVRLLYADPAYWWQEVKQWQERWGERRPLDGKARRVTLTDPNATGAGRRDELMTGKVLAFNTNKGEQWAESCGLTYAAAIDGILTHNGDEQLARHLKNARPRTSTSGLREYVTFAKQYSDSKRKIDAAVALTLAVQAWHDWKAPVVPSVFYV